MQYRGYVIHKQYYPGSDVKFFDNGKQKPVRPRPVDMDFCWGECIATGDITANCQTISELKEHIRSLNGVDL